MNRKLFLLIILTTFLILPSVNANIWTSNLDDGLLEYWEFDLGNTNGSIGVYNLSSVSAVNTSENCKIGSCFNHLSDNQYLVGSSLGLPNNTESMTMCAWLFHNSTANRDEVAMCYGTGVTTGDMRCLYNDDSSDKWGFTNNGENLLYSGIVPEEEWHLMCANNTGSSWSLVFDGVVVNNSVMTTDTHSKNLTFGRNADSSAGNDWGGAFDNSFIYDRSLTAGEFLQHWNSGDGLGYKVGFDNTFPNLTATGPSGTLATKTFNVTISAWDNVNLSYCYGNITRGATVETSNFPIDLIAQTESVTVTSDADYIFHASCNDTSNNINTSTIAFTVSTGLPPSGPPGPSGGGSTTIVIIGDATFDLTTSFDGDKYQLDMLQSTSKTEQLVFENLGQTSLDLDISCENQKGSLCQFVVVDASLSLPIGQEIKTSIPFTINIPKDVKEGDYIFTIIASESGAAKDFITIEVSLGTFGFIRSFAVKMGSSRLFGDVPFPYFFIFLFASAFAGVGINFLILKPNNFPSAISISGLIVGFIAVIII